MTERRRNLGTGSKEQPMEEHSEMKTYEVTLFNHRYEPPTYKCQVRARTIEEATARAMVQGRNFNQAQIVNHLQDAVMDVIKSIHDDGHITEQQYKAVVNATPTHEDFEIDGVLVTNIANVRGVVASEREMTDNIADGFEQLLKDEAKKEEE